MKWLKRAGYGLLFLLLVSIPAYWWLLVQSDPASSPAYAIDIAQVRRLADAQPGQKPREIRVETIGHFSAPKTFVVAGDGWQSIDLPVSSYELVYPDRVAVVDTGFSANIAKAMSATSFDGAAYSRMSGALAHASLTLATHEHPDHVGGLLAQPNLGEVLASTRLTAEQVAELKANLNSDPFAALHLPSNVFDRMQPLSYARYQPIAPGVVLIKAPGHTPGSQMVYMHRADGAEFLLLGDVAWSMCNVETGRGKARFATWIAGENRGQVGDELAALNRLHATVPQIHMIPGHDGGAIDSLVASGLLIKGF